MESWQVGGLLGTRIWQEGQSQKRDFSGGFWDTTGRQNPSSAASERARLGGQLLAKYKERKGPHLS